MNEMRFVSILAALVLVLCSSSSGQVRPVMIGILEDNPGHYSGERHYRDVRVVFRRDAKAWVAFPSSCPDETCLKEVVRGFPAKVNWTVAFDGKAVGRVVTRTPRAFEFYSTVGQQEIEAGTVPPTIGVPSMDFAGFLDEPVYRPLVTVSEPNYRDPEGWKRTELSPEALARVRNAFRRRFPIVTNCSKQDVENAKAWSYPDANIKIAKSYESNRHWAVAEAILSGYECDGPLDEPFSSQWFVITPEQQVRFLDSNMWLVDAGDYDNDGRAELVFSIDAYNRGGYNLFYDDFKQKTVFEFHYH